jgi:hypothetical protein
MGIPSFSSTALLFSMPATASRQKYRGREGMTTLIRRGRRGEEDSGTPSESPSPDRVNPYFSASRRTISTVLLEKLKGLARIL